MRLKLQVRALGYADDEPATEWADTHVEYNDTPEHSLVSLVDSWSSVGHRLLHIEPDGYRFEYRMLPGLPPIGETNVGTSALTAMEEADLTNRIERIA